MIYFNRFAIQKLMNEKNLDAGTLARLAQLDVEYVADVLSGKIEKTVSFRPVGNIALALKATAAKITV